MNLASWHRSVIGPSAATGLAPVRWALALPAWVYARIVAVRNRRYDRTGPAYTPSVPVISLGNITTGGTGKTPVAIHIARRLAAWGLTPAVLSRGYGATSSVIGENPRSGDAALPDGDAPANDGAMRNAGAHPHDAASSNTAVHPHDAVPPNTNARPHDSVPSNDGGRLNDGGMQHTHAHAPDGDAPNNGACLNDEARLIQRECPGVICLADPDRCRIARLAVERYGARVLILDDGFQHRRIQRDLDIVLIDATCPFGFGHVLPRGLLREPVSALRRADLIIITRADQAAPGARLSERLSRVAPGVPIIACRHRPAGAHRLGQPDVRVDLAGKRVACFAGIGHPEAFARTVASMGARVVARRWWPDHHEYRSEEIRSWSDSILRAGAGTGCDLLVTTAKDAVKLENRPALAGVPIVVVPVTIDFDDGGDTMLDELLDAVIRSKRPRHDASLPSSRS